MSRALVVVAVVLGACAAGSRGPSSRGAGSPRVTEIVRTGESLYWSGELDSARVLFRDGLAAAELAGDSLAKARVLTWLGLTAFRSGRLEEGRALGLEALALTMRIGDPEEMFRATNLLGLLAWRQGRLAEADSSFRLAMAAAQKAGDEDGASRALGNLALVQEDRGEFAAARDGLGQMLAAARKVGERRIEANALRDLAALDLREGSLVPAGERLTAARGLARELGYVLGEVDALTQLAYVFAAAGNYPSSVAAADSAARLAGSHGFVQEQAAALSVLGEVLGDLGSDQQALRILDSAQKINRTLDLPIEAGSVLRREAAITARLGRGDAAIHSAMEALRLHDSVGAGPERLADLLLLTSVDPERSEHWLGRAKVLADSLKFPWARFDVAFARVRSLADRRRFGDALRVLETLASEPRTGDYGEEWQYADLQAEAYRGLGRLADAEVAARSALRSYDRVRQDIGPDWARSGLLQAGVATRSRLVEILLEQGDVAGALRAADAGHVFMGSAGSVSSESPAGHATSGAGKATGEVLLARIATLSSALRDVEDHGEPGTPGDELRHRLVETRDAYERQLVARGGRGDSEVGPGTIPGLQSVLRSDEALLEYFLGPERVHLFVLTRSTIHHRVLAIDPADLAHRVRLARDLVARPESGPILAPVLERLFDLLLRPAELAPGGKWPTRLILVTPGFLAHLPFGALRDSQAGRYLIQETELVTAPSAAGLIRLRSAHASLRRAGLLVAFAPDSESLPWTAAEAREVAGSIPRGIALVGKDATERRFRLEAPRAEVVHIAAHAGLNPDNPLFSWIGLRATGAGTEEDGILEVHQVPAMHARLVFLSGCETALARGLGDAPDLVGADITTMAQAFLQAGSSEVIATLWRIPDASSSALVAAFYRGFGRRPAAQALAQAQRELLSHPRTAHPYFWAAFVLLGGSP
jgi:CHAT domain-containing protein/tetratricopeptide (TPR) repeat protein